MEKAKFGDGHRLIMEENRKKILEGLIKGELWRFGDGHYLTDGDLEKVGLTVMITARAGEEDS